MGTKGTYQRPFNKRTWDQEYTRIFGGTQDGVDTSGRTGTEASEGAPSECDVPEESSTY